MFEMNVRRRLGGAAAVILVAAGLAAAVPATTQASSIPVSIDVLSGRTDLVTGGSALIAVNLPPNPTGVWVKLGTTNITNAFAVRSDGRYEGLVTGLSLGANTLSAHANGAGTATITLTNHPDSGPLFAGPQLKPWTCQATAVDPATCAQAPTYDYVYKSTDPTKLDLQPYNPASPPTDVADTTTDTGVTMPFVVRRETGYLDRDQYQISTLWNPVQSWSAVAPQASFNHKFLIDHGASCGVEYQTGTAPSTSSDGYAGVVGPTQAALGRGFVTMSNALDNSGHDCNVALQAESLVITKEHAIKTYGSVRFTIGYGCSGGSLAEQWIANAYPGIYQGILPTCSFPDAWSIATQFVDYHLLLQYLTDPTKWDPGVAWTPTQMAAVEGHVDPANAEVSEQAQFHVAVPTDPCGGTTSANRYDATTNPTGVRCTVQDAVVNLLGRNPQSQWSAAEKAAGFGFALPPVDNVGVQYGLAALQSGTITPQMFVDLNKKVGGLDIDIKPTTARIGMAVPALANAYRTGLINEANNLDQTPIIDCRGPDPGLFHDSYRAFAMRARLDRDFGGHASQLIWEGPVPILGDQSCETNGLTAMDRWLEAIAHDTNTSASLGQKVAADKPANLTDRCYNGTGVQVSSTLCGQVVVPVYGTPRTVAGQQISVDANKCQLKPLSRSSYTGVLGLPVLFTDQQWADLQALYPNGVCDYSQLGVDQQGTIPWQTYQDANGSVIYGGTPMTPAPTSSYVSDPPSTSFGGLLPLQLPPL